LNERSAQFKNLGTSLDALLVTLGLSKKIKQHAIINQWADLVGASISSVAMPDRIYDGVLFVKVKNISWRTELSFQKKQIMQKIEEEIGAGLIKDIRFI
jgi:predicted nucleic acid-binding Zn ribbon protein